MLTNYRLARGAGHSIFKALAFALFGWELPSRSEEIQRQIEEIHARRKRIENKSGRANGS
jgi:hypothetical protein